MNKSELIDAVKDKAGIKRTEAQAVVEALIATVSETLSEGGSVSLTGFGVFKVKERPARTGRNPATSEVIEIPASRAPVFAAGKLLKEAVLNSGKPA